MSKENVYVSLSFHNEFRANLMRLVKDSVSTDTTLLVGKTEMPVHRVILSAASPYFAKIFKRIGPHKDVCSESNSIDVSIVVEKQ